MNEKLLANVRFYFAQSVINATCHFKAYDRICIENNRLNYMVATLSATTLMLLVLQIIGLQQKNQDLLNLLAFIGIILTGSSLAFQIFNKDNKTIGIFQHKFYAEKYKFIRDEYMSLIEEIMSNATAELELRERKNSLQKRYSEIGENAPKTTANDFKQTKISLGLQEKKGEEFTWSDEQIDRFLPQQLRLAKA